mgnify:CR=1 FL=1
MANYRTRSNTQKLQRLIEFLKERDCDSAANLEETAQVFLNDVKPKAHIEGEKFLLSFHCQRNANLKKLPYDDKGGFVSEGVIYFSHCQNKYSKSLS